VAAFTRKEVTEEVVAISRPPKAGPRTMQAEPTVDRAAFAPASWSSGTSRGVVAATQEGYGE
jgi:hypothetical protein